MHLDMFAIRAVFTQETPEPRRESNPTELG